MGWIDVEPAAHRLRLRLFVEEAAAVVQSPKRSDYKTYTFTADRPPLPKPARRTAPSWCSPFVTGNLAELGTKVIVVPFGAERASHSAVTKVERLSAMNQASLRIIHESRQAGRRELRFWRLAAMLGTVLCLVGAGGFTAVLVPFAVAPHATVSVTPTPTQSPAAATFATIELDSVAPNPGAHDRTTPRAGRDGSRRLRHLPAR